jgi:3-hydroxyisobutyrate dehydrogenase-like beta-hydroxyacid dehydrogenase
MAKHVCDVIAFSGANSTAFQRLRPYVIEGNDQLFCFSLANAHKDMHCYARLAGEARAVLSSTMPSKMRTL